MFGNKKRKKSGMKTFTRFRVCWIIPEGYFSEDGFYTLEEAIEYGSQVDSYCSDLYEENQYVFDIETYEVSQTEGILDMPF